MCKKKNIKVIKNVNKQNKKVNNIIKKVNKVVKIKKNTSNKNLPFNLLPFSYNVYMKLPYRIKRSWTKFLLKKLPQKNKIKFKLKKKKRTKHWWRFRYEFIVKRRKKNFYGIKKKLKYRLKHFFRLKLLFKKFMVERYLLLNYKQFKKEWKKYKIKRNTNSFFCYISMRLDNLLVKSHFCWSVFKARLAIKKREIFLNNIECLNINKKLFVGDKIHIKRFAWRNHMKLWAIKKIHMKKISKSLNFLVVDYWSGSSLIISEPKKKEFKSKLSVKKTESWLKTKIFRILVNSFF